MNILILPLAFLFTNVNPNEHVCDIHISGIRNHKGNLIVSVFDTEESFRKEEALIELVISKDAVRNGELKTSVSLPDGTYGIAMLDDENADGEMKYNLIGMPKEGFGFSDYELKGLKKPRLKDFAFIIDGQRKKVKIMVKYM